MSPRLPACERVCTFSAGTDIGDRSKQHKTMVRHVCTGSSQCVVLQLQGKEVAFVRAFVRSLTVTHSLTHCHSLSVSSAHLSINRSIDLTSALSAQHTLQLSVCDGERTNERTTQRRQRQRTDRTDHDDDNNTQHTHTQHNTRVVHQSAG